MKKNCSALESRAARLKEILPMCEQVMRLGIGFSELVAFHTAVIKRADSGNITTESAAYRVMEEVESYERIGNLKNEISKLVMQKFTIDQIWAQRNKAITSLIKLQFLGVIFILTCSISARQNDALQSYGVTDKVILRIYEFLNTRSQNGRRIQVEPILGAPK